MEFSSMGWANQMGVGSGGFSPSDLPNLELWTQYNSGITITGSGVSQWDDVSGNGNHLKQATDTNRPLPGSTGSELVTNGGFDSDTGWTKGDGWTIAAGVASCDGTQVAVSTLTNTGITFTSGLSYLHVFTVSNYSAGSVRAQGSATARSANGTYSEILTSTTAASLFADAAFVGDIDNVSVKLVTIDGSILFDGVDNFLKADAFTLVQPETIYLLVKQVTWTNADFIFDGHALLNNSLRQSGITPDLVLQGNATTSANSDATIGIFEVITSIFNSTSSVLQIDNNAPLIDNAGTLGMGGFTLGTRGDAAGQWSNIQVKECLIYSEAHDASQRAQIINYLQSI